MNKDIIHIQSLEVGYKQSSRYISLLPPINLGLKKGEFVALVGPNGAGKSTFLRTVSGLQSAVKGNVFIEGTSIHDLSLAERSRLLSIVLTDHPDDFYLKTEDVVASGRYPYTNFWAKLKQDDLDIISQSMDSCGVRHLSGRRLISLSDGERQKVMIAKALAQSTPIIIMDEPAAFLDYPSKIELMQLLQKLTKHEGKTILFSSHDLDLVLRSSDRLWLMAPNQPVIDGTPEELVLKGWINTYFDKPGLHFDAQMGHFISKAVTKKLVKISVPDPIHKKWVSNALLRIGYHPTEESTNNSAEIQFYDQHYLVVYSEKKNSFESLDKMIDFFKHEMDNKLFDSPFSKSYD